MTYLNRPVAPFKIDFLRQEYSGTISDNPEMSLSGSLDNTRATYSGTTLTLYSGSHWRIEFGNTLLRQADGLKDLLFLASIYSVTDGAVIGTKGTLSLLPRSSPTADGWKSRGRVTACALVLSSEISTSIDVRFRIEALGSQLKIMSGSNNTRWQSGIIKIMELPA
tara:strand:+ start:547 stop:1044 length:498 start_codon:yes stop_codon:yes gene_type:complete